jgi:hypothetical protein
MLSLQDKLEELLAQQGGASASSPATLTALPTDGFVTNGATYHLPSCRTVQGRSGLELVSAEDAAARELTPCRVCRPAA